MAGITPATYQPPTAGSLSSALGACSTTIQEAIQAQGIRKRNVEETQIDPGVQFKVLAGLLEKNALQFIILMHEAKAGLVREGQYMIGIRYEYEAKTNGLGAGGNGYFDVNQFCNRLADAELLTIDLRNRVGLTERGHAFAEWLVASGYKADYFWSDFGSWGERPERLKDRKHPSLSPRNLFELQEQAQQQAQAKTAVTVSEPVSLSPAPVAKNPVPKRKGPRHTKKRK